MSNSLFSHDSWESFAKAEGAEKVLKERYKAIGRKKAARMKKRLDVRGQTPYWKLYKWLSRKAKKMRLNPTPSESLMKAYLESLDIRFICQQPFCFKDGCRKNGLKGYIVDFYLFDIGLILEIDGGYHNSIEQSFYDAHRTKRIEGIATPPKRIIRFKNQEVNALDFKERLRVILSQALSEVDVP